MGSRAYVGAPFRAWSSMSGSLSSSWSALVGASSDSLLRDSALEASRGPAPASAARLWHESPTASSPHTLGAFSGVVREEIARHHAVPSALDPSEIESLQRISRSTPISMDFDFNSGLRADSSAGCVFFEPPLVHMELRFVAPVVCPY